MRGKKIEPRIGLKLNAAEAIDKKHAYSEQVVAEIEATKARIYADYPKLPEPGEVGQWRQGIRVPALKRTGDISKLGMNSALAPSFKRKARSD